MNVRAVLRATRVCLVAAFPLLVHASCARTSEEAPSQPVLFGTDASTAPITECVETRCPEPFATCPGVLKPCSVNLRTDIQHCGSCDTPCPRLAPNLHASALCSEGECKFACNPLHADCNDSPADGCETSTANDPQNCGGCGLACEAGVLCWRGACGCPNGFTQCGDECKKLDSDDNNCGACGSLCREPKDDADPRWQCGPGVNPPNTKWTCTDSECKLQCRPPHEDCNADFCGDGCEIDVSRDPQNCGACGNQCAPGQWCKGGRCACPAGTQECRGECVDYSRDPMNCGGCGNECPGLFGGSGSHGGPGCVNGECTYACDPGYANCDGRLANGCEAHLETDQNHCGDCKTACQVAAGQPCVGGKCLTKPCDEVIIP